MSTPAPLVLVVDDELQVRRFVRVTLVSHGFRVLEAASVDEGVRQAAGYAPDVVLLDLGLPDGDGLTLLRSLREWTSVPVLVLSARGDEAAKVDVLDAGADDYVTKPFGAAELAARIRVALRHAARVRATATTVVKIGGDIELDLVRRVVTRKAAEVHLTQLEYKLLVALAKHAGMVLTHRQLLAAVWGPGHSEDVQYLRVYMTQLRQKLEEDAARPRHLLTELGVGYRLRTEA